MAIKTKCDGCGSFLAFDPKSQMLSCANCGRKVEIAKDIDCLWKNDFSKDSKPNLNKKFDTCFECAACGAKIDTRASKVVSACPYCGSTNVEEVNKALAIEPDAIIPFRVSRAKAIALYKEWIKQRPFAPNDVKKFSRLDERLVGKYVPAWVFDAHIETDYSGVGENDHHYTERRGDHYVTRTTTTTHHFSGHTSSDYDNYCINADPAKVSDVSFSKLANYNFKELKVFSSEYMLGFLTSNVTKDLETSWTDARMNIENHIDFAIRADQHYDRIVSFDSRHEFSDVKWILAYLPIWTSKFVYKQKEYNFYVNGATGNVVGKSPKSFWKIFFTALFWAAVVAGVGYVIYLLSR